MILIQDYLEKTKYYKNKYGKNTIVLMQVGAFYEVYALKNQNGELMGSEIEEFARICDISIVDKKICVGENNVYMSGVRDYMLDKHINKLQKEGYTIPVYDQDINAPNTTRSLRCIYSSGTTFENDNNIITNNIISTWIFDNKKELIIGISNINILTGKTNVFEYQVENINSPITFDELERFISIYNPGEIIIITNLDDKYVQNIISYSNINSKQQHIYNISETNQSQLNPEILSKIKNCEGQSYQNTLIEKFFTFVQKEEISESFYNYPILYQSFCFLLDFINDHNPHLVHKLDIPIFDNYTERLILANHTLKQLNIIENENSVGRYSSVHTFLNKCKTNMGKRRFTYNLLNPSSNSLKLQKEYDIQAFLLENYEEFMSINPLLCEIKDIEKFSRKIILKQLNPSNLVSLYKTIKNIMQIYNNITNFENLNNYLNEQIKLNFNCVFENCEKISNEIYRVINIESAESINSLNFEKNFFNRGIHQNIDNEERKFVESLDKLKCIKNFYDNILQKTEKKSKTNDYVKIHTTTADIGLNLTIKRSKVLELELNKPSTSEYVELTYTSSYDGESKTFSFNTKDFNFMKSTASNVSINNSQIKECCINYNHCKEDLKQVVYNVYIEFINKMQVYDSELKNISEYISIIDVLHNNVHLSKKYNYCKPEIIHNHKSFFKGTKIRHCLIEHIQTNELYVTNDISLDDSQLGILLYGTNAVGKTSFIRSIGINIIMAQAGLYVPCETFEYFPYKNIFSRIIGNDNLFKGLSTFAVEMYELRNILKYANKDSLILGDELCSGTEIDSAKSIFVSGIQHLHNIKSNFIFATHLHEIVSYQEVQELEFLSMKHLTVQYDYEKDRLIFDRIIKDGPGETSYGLEFCKSLNMPKEFLSNAYNLRNKYSKDESILSLSKSHFNREKIIGMCQLCNNEKASEVHHLQYQNNANEKGYIDSSFHKNHLANLCNICNECHKKIHKDNLELKVKKTSDGYDFFTI